MRFSFEVPGKPVPQGSMRALGPGRMVHSNRAELLPWRATVAAHAIQAKPAGWDNSGPMLIEASFHLPRPKNHYRANGELKPKAPWWPPVKPDLDKLCRALMDALTDAGVWGDDSQVVELHVLKLYHPGPGRLLCQVQRLTEKGEQE